MGYKVVRSEECDQDLDLIFRHLVDSHVLLGEPLSEAFQRAVRRIGAIEADMEALARAPHQGSLDPQIAAGLRHVTKNRAVFYFNVNDDMRCVRVIAVFIGGQDHQQHMLKRLLR